jgi:apolipoprotein N-acyltransferase
MSGRLRRVAVRLGETNLLSATMLLWLGTAAGLARGNGWSLLALAGLLIMFWRATAAATLVQAALKAICFGVGESAVCFLGTYSWGAQVPLALTVLGVLLHHLPLGLWAWSAPRLLRAPWLWVASIGVSSSLCSFAELIGLPSREAVVLVTTLPELVGGARVFGSDLITGLVETGLFASALALMRRNPLAPWSAAFGQAFRPILLMTVGLGAASGLATGTALPADGGVSVGIPQVAADSSYYRSRLLATSVARTFDHNFEALLERLARPELIVTTEGFDGRFGLMLPDVRDAWAARVRSRRQAWIVTSYIVKEDGRKSNAAGVFAADGRLVGIHEKVDLAPFGERDLAPGDAYRPLAIAPGISLGILICQESYLRRGSQALAQAGANLLAATTSDVTFGSSTTVIEHLAMTELRAIESGRSIIWASNAGPSGVIDRRGRFHHGPFREPAAVELTASLYSDLTPFHRFAPFWLALGPLLTIIGLITARRPLPQAMLPAPTTSPSRRVRVLLRSGAALLVLALAGATAVGASALIEAHWGRPQRALTAITDTFGRKPVYRDDDPYRRFARPPGHSAEGAIAYLLEYYGLDRDDSKRLSELAPRVTMDDVARLLQQRYGLATRRVDLRGALPLTPMLLRAPDGNFAVVDYAGSGQGGLIDFATGTARYIASSELAQLRGVEALFPYAAAP